MCSAGNPYILLPRFAGVQSSILALPISDSGFRGRGPFTKKSENANALPYAGVFHTAEQLLSALTQINCAEPLLRARFLGDHGLVTWVTSVQANSLTRTVWRFHVPRIWIRSIKPCGLPVKRKSQNLANFSSTRLYLVVPLRVQPSSFLLFLLFLSS